MIKKPFPIQNQNQLMIIDKPDLYIKAASSRFFCAFKNIFY